MVLVELRCTGVSGGLGRVELSLSRFNAAAVKLEADEEAVGLCSGVPQCGRGMLWFTWFGFSWTHI